MPRGHSLRARQLNQEIAAGDIAADKLTVCQHDAASGLYAEAMSGFLHWLAPRYEEVRGQLAAERAELRDAAASDGQHARTPGIVADLSLGLRYFLAFAVEVGAIDAGQQQKLWEEGWEALCAAGATQAEHIKAMDPVDQFLRLISAAVASGRAHLAGKDGQAPKNAKLWGWRYVEGNGPIDPYWRDQGKRIGWVDGENVYLDPDAAYATAQGLASEQGESLTVSLRTLYKRLRDRELLASWESKRNRTTVRRSLEGSRERDVLHLLARVLFARSEHTEGNRTVETSDSDGRKTEPSD